MPATPPATVRRRNLPGSPTHTQPPTRTRAVRGEDAHEIPIAVEPCPQGGDRSTAIGGRPAEDSSARYLIFFQRDGALIQLVSPQPWYAWMHW